ncbi:MAG: hypothetical protein GX335_07690 [Firmicutes bacterium]|mgnify:CR=1 FL=1|nr:hypothetical protein [Bacillota bacterium]
MKRILWVIIIVAVLTSVWIAAHRWALEKSNFQVELVYDFPALQGLSGSTGMEMENLLRDLRRAGIRSLGIQATSLGEWFLAQKPLSREFIIQLGEEKDLKTYLDFPLAFEKSDLDLIRDAGFEPVPKISPAPWDVEPIWLDYNPRLIVASGSGEIKTGFLKTGVRLGLAEFSKLNLDQKNLNLVRVHGISAPELRLLSDQRIINRYLRAAKERNIRVLYLRPFESAWPRSLQLIETLKTALEAAGFSVGRAAPFPVWSVPPPATSLVWAGIWAGTALFGIHWFPRCKQIILVAAVCAWLGSLLIGLFYFSLSQQALALLAAVVFPSLALQINKGRTPLKRYLWISLVSLLGAFLVAGTLTGTEYLVKLEEFRGVKLMHLAPVLLAFLAVVRPLRRWLNESVPIKYLALAGAAGLLGLLYLRRTGNFGGLVLEGEIVVREFLEKVLGARPRTKEFLIGHPALYFLVREKDGKKSWWLPLAAVGQLSLVNSFTHIYTPLKLSLLRTAYGLFFGYLIGWAVRRCYLRGKRWFKGDRGFGLLRVRQPR